MPGAWTQNFYHAVFSTKGRAPIIGPDLKERLYAYIGGILREMRCRLVAGNGMPDHAHLLVQYRPDLSHSDLLRHVKARSSKWVHETFPDTSGFAWQEGYGGFSVSKSVVPAVEEYIVRQEEHHRHRTFEEEFIELLRKHGIEFDVNKVFDELARPSGEDMERRNRTPTPPTG